MASKRKHKRDAVALGLTDRELVMAEVLEEVLDSLRWQQILGYSNQFLMTRHLDIDRAERDRVLEAATRAVEKDRRLHEWQTRLARVKSEVERIRRAIEPDIEAIVADNPEDQPSTLAPRDGAADELAF